MEIVLTYEVFFFYFKKSFLNKAFKKTLRLLEILRNLQMSSMDRNKI